MSVFKEMLDQSKFKSFREFTELRRMLRQAVDRGYVEEVPVCLTGKVAQVEYWYRDTETGDVYSLRPPEFPAQGYWGLIQPERYQYSTKEIKQ